jgi:hypothetical protein
LVTPALFDGKSSERLAHAALLDLGILFSVATDASAEPTAPRCGWRLRRLLVIFSVTQQPEPGCFFFRSIARNGVCVSDALSRCL